MELKISSDQFIALSNEDDLVGLVLKLTGGFANPPVVRAQIQNAKQRQEFYRGKASFSQPQKGEK